MRSLAVSALASCVLVVACNHDEPAGSDDTSVALCSGGVYRCFARTRVDADGNARTFATPQGFGPPDLLAAYNVDTTNSVGLTIGLIEAYGYPALESDLAMYRSTYSLPPCTVASGCLTILNQSGQISPLPGPPPQGDDWVGETALDVAMVSSGCPSCKIVVVEATNDFGSGLLVANNVAATAGAAVISNSWGAPEGSSEAGNEQYIDHPGVAVFAATGDNGYDDGGAGPEYPATSAYAIGVGGTSLVHDTSIRGWSESAWGGAGSSCSNSIAKPGWQTSTACARRMTADISAIADPATGVAIYDSAAGGWSTIGGTSAASPLVAAIFAQTGHAGATAEYIYQNATGFFDVTSGANGNCTTELCKAGTGWDGPTGNGTPNGAVLAGAKVPTLVIDAPSESALVAPGFTIQVDCTSADSTTIREVDITIDAERLGVYSAPPYMLVAPSALHDGKHTVTVTCTTTALASATSTLTVTQGAACSATSPCPDTNQVCYDGACIDGPNDSDGLGATCTAGSDCQSGTCTTAGSDSLCSAACDTGSADVCPKGFTCQKQGGSDVCWPGSASSGGCTAGGGDATWLFGLVAALVTARTRRNRRSRAARRCLP